LAILKKTFSAKKSDNLLGSFAKGSGFGGLQGGALRLNKTALVLTTMSHSKH